MEITRRNFCKTLLLSGSILFLPHCARNGEVSVKQDTDEPAYINLEKRGKFVERVEQALSLFEHCDLCPRRCGVNRSKGELGACRAPDKVVVYSRQPHFGEELPLVGKKGSGTIFFSNCNLRCVFCQNWPIAHEGRGAVISDDKLADLMLDIQTMGCHNINLVTPTHVMPNILNATRLAMQKGLKLPLCYNTGGYELTKNIKLLEGIVDIYLPDMKFMNADHAELYAGGAKDYPESAKAAISEMHRQVGDLVLDQRGIAARGLMVRHLVMPNRIAGTQEFVKWAAQHLSPSTYINIMPQYRVEHRAFEYPQIARAITREEFIEAINWAKEAGLTNLDQRSLASYERFRRN